MATFPKYSTTIGSMGAAVAVAALAMARTVAAAPNVDDRARFRDTYREFVETNTTLSAGDCTLAAQRMAARLRAAGVTPKVPTP